LLFRKGNCYKNNLLFSLESAVECRILMSKSKGYRFIWSYVKLAVMSNDMCVKCDRSIEETSNYKLYPNEWNFPFFPSPCSYNCPNCSL